MFDFEAWSVTYICVFLVALRTLSIGNNTQCDLEIGTEKLLSFETSQRKNNCEDILT